MRPGKPAGSEALGTGLREDVVRPDISMRGTDQGRSEPSPRFQPQTKAAPAELHGHRARWPVCCLLQSPARPGHPRIWLEPAQFPALGLAKLWTNSELSTGPALCFPRPLGWSPGASRLSSVLSLNSQVIMRKVRKRVIIRQQCPAVTFEGT